MHPTMAIGLTSPKKEIESFFFFFGKKEEFKVDKTQREAADIYKGSNRQVEENLLARCSIFIARGGLMLL